jgi:hypothetical protein
MFTSPAPSVPEAAMVIVPVRPTAAANEAPAPGAVAGLLRRTLGRGNYTRRTLGKNNYTRRTLGKGTNSRRTFGQYHP